MERRRKQRERDKIEREQLELAVEMSRRDEAARQAAVRAEQEQLLAEFPAECPVCLEDMEPPLFKPCGWHAMHVHCAMIWKRADSANSANGRSPIGCPVCRMPIWRLANRSTDKARSREPF